LPESYPIGIATEIGHTQLQACCKELWWRLERRWQSRVCFKTTEETWKRFGVLSDVVKESFGKYWQALKKTLCV